MTTFAERKQRIYDELASLEARIDSAVPNSLPYEFWSEILEVVERLPNREERAWKDRNIVRLREVVQGVRSA